MNRCKCCLRERSSKDLWSEHFYHGDVENYGQMLNDCFKLSWHETESVTERICHPCIGRLREAHDFRRQVLEAEQLLSSIENEDEAAINQKVEDFLEKHLNIKQSTIVKANTADDDDGMEALLLEADNADTTDHFFFDDDMEPQSNFTEIEYLEMESEEQVIQEENENPKAVVLIGDTVVQKISNNTFVRPKSLDSPSNKKEKIVKLAQSSPEKTDVPSTKNVHIVTIENIDEILKQRKRNKQINPKQQNKNLQTPLVFSTIKPKKVQTATKETNYQIKPIEHNKNLQMQLEREKHQDNAVALLLATNATPIHSKRDTGFECGFCNGHFYVVPAHLKAHIIKDHTDEEKKKYLNERELCNLIFKLDITNLQCRHCNLPLKDLETALAHLPSHNITIHTDILNHIIPYKFESDSYKCFICDYEYKGFQGLTNHMNEHYGQYMCSQCGKGFLTNRMTQMHMRIHDDGDFQCSYCPKKFTVRIKWMMHERYHLKDGPLKANKCGFCGKVFRDYESKQLHLHIAHGTRRKYFQCDTCSKKLTSKKTLRNHIQNLHLKIKRYQCTECVKEFFEHQALVRHVDTKHLGKKKAGFKCKYCPKRFSKEGWLHLHLKAHEEKFHHET